MEREFFQGSRNWLRRVSRSTLYFAFFTQEAVFRAISLSLVPDANTRPRNNNCIKFRMTLGTTVLRPSLKELVIDGY